MSLDEACPHGVTGGCPPCIMRKGDTIAEALAMLPVRRKGPPSGVRLARVDDRITLIRDDAVVIKDLEQAVTLVPEMLELLREFSDAWDKFVRDNPQLQAGDGVLEEDAFAVKVRRFLARIDGAP